MKKKNLYIMGVVMCVSALLLSCGSREYDTSAQDWEEKVKSLFYFVRDEIRYNPYLPKYLTEHFRASNTLSRGDGYCVQKAVVLVALARAVGIPARLGFAKIRNNLLPEKLTKWLGGNVLPWHGYAELYIDSKWVKATTAFDLKMCHENRIIPVEFDGEHDATFQPYNLDGKLHIEYLMQRGHYEDVPLDKIRETLVQIFGAVYVPPPE